MSDGRLEVDGLTKSFGAVRAVDDVTLSFESGDCHGLIGPNGSGKTTLFDLVTGFARPDSGVVRFDGRDVTGESPDRLARRGLVRTFQIVSPFEGLTVRENLHSVYETGLRADIRVPESTAERAQAVLDLLDLADVADHEASDISGGQSKLLELGRALMRDPDCLLLDEPTAGVNPAVQERVVDALRAVNDEGTTLVVIEHDMQVVEDIADRITVLNDGRVLTRGSFSSVVENQQVRDAYIGDGRSGAAEPAIPGATDGRSATDSTAVPDDRLTTAFTSHTDSAARERLVANDVVAGYGSHVVLDGVTVRSHDGITCVFGPNGSGKSTLLKAIGGVVPVRSGTVAYGDRTLTDAEPHEVVEAGVTTVPQTDRIFESLTVRETLQLGATAVADDAVVDRRRDVVLDLFPSLASSLSDPARSLSGGQQVMLAVAKAMMTGADVYLLDEPFSGLAPSMIDDLADVLRTLTEMGIQVVLVEQHVQEALPLADHVYVLALGEIQFDGKPAELRDADEIVDLYLGIDRQPADRPR